MLELDTEFRGLFDNFITLIRNSITCSNLTETGLILASCRHDSPLRAINIIRSEATWRLLKNISEDEECPTHIVSLLCHCQGKPAELSAPQTRVPSPESRPSMSQLIAIVAKLSTILRQSERMGLADGESCERIWSMLRHV